MKASACAGQTDLTKERHEWCEWCLKIKMSSLPGREGRREPGTRQGSSSRPRAPPSDGGIALSLTAIPNGHSGCNTSSTPSFAGETELLRFSVQCVLSTRQVPHIWFALGVSPKIPPREAMGFASAASVARVRVRGLGLTPGRTHGARPSWQSSCPRAGSTPGSGTVIKLITGLQKGVGGEVGEAGR